MRAFVAVTESSWMAERFVTGLDGRTMFMSYGRQFPNLDEFDSSSMWLAGGYAARLHRIGLAGSLIAPGQDWLSTVDPMLTGRKIVTGPLLVMPEGVSLFVKPAEAKIDAITAGFYTYDDIVGIYHASAEGKNPIPADTLLQWTDTIMELNYEHRFMVVDGQVVTGSPYLIDGVVYSGSMVSGFYADAEAFARFAVKELGDNQPAAYSLDVGFDAVSNSWVIIEANPAWSSGIYGCDAKKFVDVLDVACNTVDPRWLWSPAQYLVEAAGNLPMMEVVDGESSSGIFMYNGS